MKKLFVLLSVCLLFFGCIGGESQPVEEPTEQTEQPSEEPTEQPSEEPETPPAEEPEEPPEEEPESNEMEAATQAISNADAAIEAAKAAGKDTTAAEAKLTEAEQKLHLEQFTEAKQLAEEAKTLAENAESADKLSVEYTENPEQSFSMYFVYVGTEEKQGDAIFIKKGDLDVLIDGGPSDNNAIISFLKEKGVDDIDLLISSHADPEHYGQMSNIIDEFDVEQFWWAGSYDGDDEYQKLLDDIEAKGIPMQIVYRGDKAELNGMTFEVWNPTEDSTFRDLDNNAIVLKVTDRNFCAFLTSDIMGGTQNELVNNVDFTCAIFQAPYHGLGTGNIQVGQLLGLLDPEVVIVSGGPSEAVGGARGPLFSRLDTPPDTTPYYQNYIGSGLTVKIISDGQTYDVGYVN